MHFLGNIRRLLISIHALPAESDHCNIIYSGAADISIHALLAESDQQTAYFFLRKKHFYPRSPCGERRRLWLRLSLSDYFYPRSPCGERRFSLLYCR